MHFDPQTLTFTAVSCIAACFACGIAQTWSWLAHLIIGRAALAAELLMASNMSPWEAALAVDSEPFAFFFPSLVAL